MENLYSYPNESFFNGLFSMTDEPKYEPISLGQMKLLFDEHKLHIDKKFDEQHSRLQEQTRALGDYVVRGFERVGEQLVTELKSVRETLIPSATNERKMDIKVIMPIIHTLCAVITALIIWFTGIRPFIPNSTKTFEAPNSHVEESR